MKRETADWNYTDLVPEFDFLADDGKVVECKNDFAFYCNGWLIKGRYYGNVVLLKWDYQNVEIEGALIDRFKECFKDAQYLTAEYRPTKESDGLAVYTYWEYNEE